MNINTTGSYTPINVDYLIIGQGLCGTWLSYFLEQQQQSFLIIDENKNFTSSKIASGVINPVTGRIIAQTWMIDELLPYALQQYHAIGQQLNVPLVSSSQVLHFLPSQQMKEQFDKRVPEIPQYLQHVQNAAYWKNYFEVYYGVGSICPALLINVQLLLQHWQQHLLATKKLLHQKFVLQKLINNTNGVVYENINAKKIIFCDGIASAENPYFKLLPFAPNKGQALIVEIKNLPATNIYKKGVTIVPLPQQNLFWVGSSYENEFENDLPTQHFYDDTIRILQSWLKLPFTIIDHWAAVRPTNMDRRPFVGEHPLHKNICIFNGTGTKGCSLAPWFANELVQNFVYQKPINPAADIQRFKKTLQRNATKN
jgi:glycine/D-amino acid oxidase-like deaminating enzyme